MILRKPYGFLIRHFRLIHLIITGIVIYLAKFSTDIYKYINSCIADQVNRYNALDYINYNIYIYIAIGLVLFGIIYWLFKYKDKPRNVYVFSIIGYIIIAIFLYIVFEYFTALPNNIIDQKVIRAYRDITLMTLVFQYIITIIMLLRGLGFDIKKFNFTKDIQELNLTTEDAEEIEVDVSVNTNAIMRGVRRQKRELGYFFQEYKVFILGIIAIIIFTVGYFGYNYIKKEFKVYNQGEVIGYMYRIVVNDSYFSMNSDKNIIIVNIGVSKYGIEDKLDINSLKLLIDDIEYVPNKNICNSFDYLGNCYKKQYINSDSKSYILTYEVDSFNLERTYLVYKENYDDKFKIKLDLESYD